MVDRLRALSSGVVGGVLWGVVLAWWYDAPLARGVSVGLRVWVPILLVSLRWRSTEAWAD